MKSQSCGHEIRIYETRIPRGRPDRCSTGPRAVPGWRIAHRLPEPHQVTSRQNARKRGSALYGGCDADSRFHWRFQNPADRDLHSVIRLPLPAATAMYDNLSAVLNGKDILPQLALREATLTLNRD